MVGACARQLQQCSDEKNRLRFVLSLFAPGLLLVARRWKAQEATSSPPTEFGARKRVCEKSCGAERESSEGADDRVGSNDGASKRVIRRERTAERVGSNDGGKQEDDSEGADERESWVE